MRGWDVLWEEKQLSVKGVGAGPGMGVGPGTEGGVVDVAFCPPGAKVGVCEKHLADQVREA